MRISESPTRRGVLAGLAAGSVLVALPAAAQAVGRAQALITDLSAEMTRLVNSGKAASQLYGEFEAILARYADMPAVAASILGPPWRSASEAQKRAFVPAFQHYLSRKYGRQFEQYRDARINVTGAKDAGRSGVLVNTVVVRPGQEDIRVDWQIGERSGRPQAVNLIIEGVSMLANERAEIGAMLEAQGGRLDPLIAQLGAWG